MWMSSTGSFFPLLPLSSGTSPEGHRHCLGEDGSVQKGASFCLSSFSLPTSLLSPLCFSAKRPFSGRDFAAWLEWRSAEDEEEGEKEVFETRSSRVVSSSPDDRSRILRTESAGQVSRKGKVRRRERSRRRKRRNGKKEEEWEEKKKWKESLGFAMCFRVMDLKRDTKNPSEIQEKKEFGRKKERREGRIHAIVVITTDSSSFSSTSSSSFRL